MNDCAFSSQTCHRHQKPVLQSRHADGCLLFSINIDADEKTFERALHHLNRTDGEQCSIRRIRASLDRWADDEDQSSDLQIETIHQSDICSVELLFTMCSRVNVIHWHVVETLDDWKSRPCDTHESAFPTYRSWLNLDSGVDTYWFYLFVTFTLSKILTCILDELNECICRMTKLFCSNHSWSILLEVKKLIGTWSSLHVTRQEPLATNQVVIVQQD